MAVRGVDLLTAHPSPGRSRSARRGVLEGEQDLEERVAGGRALRGEDFDEPFEGHVLVGVGGEVASRTRPSRSAKVGSPERSVRRTSVLTKKPTRSFEGFVGAAGDGGAEGDVVAGAEPVQEGGEGRLDGS